MESIAPEPGMISLAPAFVAVATAIITRRPIESLLAGVFSGLLILGPADAMANFSSIMLEVMMNETIAWVIIVCGLMGSIIALVMHVGAANAFSKALADRADSGSTALLYTWLLGLLIFIDDYLNALAVGSSMRKVTDKFGISREKLAYVVDSTAAPICVLLPVSTWSVFFSGVLESSGAAEPGEGLALYISGIPYMLYAWVAALLVPLVALGKIPDLGMMKAAEQAAREKLAARGGETPITETEKPSKAKIYHFVLPIAAMLGFSIWNDLDVQLGVISAVGFTVVLYGAQGLMSWTEALDTVMEGIKIMVPALSIVVVAFMFGEVSDRLGLASYVITTVTPYMTPALLPLVVFITMALISFATGSSWGVFAVAIPIVMPLAESVGISPALAVGALISASAFGSHACFYSDATVLAAQGSGCGVMEHALTQIPYAMIAATIAAIGLTVLASI